MGLNVLLAWFWQVFHPIQTVNDLLQHKYTSRADITFADRINSPLVQVWTTGLTIAFAVEWIWFSLSKIETSPQFLVLYQMTVIAIIGTNVTILFGLLRLVRVNIDFITLIICYSTTVILLPISDLSQVLPSYRFVLFLRSLRELHQSPWETLGYFFCHAKQFIPAQLQHDFLYNWVDESSDWLWRAMLLVTGVLLSEGIAQVAGAPRRRVYIAVVMGRILSLLAYLILLFCQAMLLVMSMK
ncbi:hypothetical protein [Methylovirgula ligni]|uniref:hypothetical protein n=1 Tax=Methylovirgula ligni TaxID=569860 RepID=UPI0011C063EB|nr:hypothetical protein [Methylovirgula ligni]